MEQWVRMDRQIHLVRHGETEWSRTGRHTGRTDVALTPEGERQAEALGRTLTDRPLSAWTSPLQRARETCRLAGFAETAQIDPDLREWDYGVYEGLTTAEIRRGNPDWSIWDAEIKGGESLEEVAARARRVIARVTENGGNAVLFGHGHILRILAACWLGLPAVTGRYLALDTASLSTLGYERDTRVIRGWNFIPAVR